jgi:hypothetical protein
MEEHDEREERPFEGTPLELKIRGRVKRSERKRFADYFAL